MCHLIISHFSNPCKFSDHSNTSLSHSNVCYVTNLGSTVYAFSNTLTPMPVNGVARGMPAEHVELNNISCPCKFSAHSNTSLSHNNVCYVANLGITVYAFSNTLTTMPVKGVERGMPSEHVVLNNITFQ
jgi:hypothetical protein